MNESKVVSAMSEIKKKGGIKIALLLLAVGLVLIFVGNSNVFKAASEEGGECEHEEKLNIEDYELALESDIERFCKGLLRVSSVSASVRLSGSTQSIYAKNSNNGTGSVREEYVIIGSGSNAHPIYLGEISPEILGIGVIIYSDGGELQKSQIEELLGNAYGVPLNRIYVKIINTG
jgi:hypothetical protein